ncbi:MAG: HAMP domain-containing protein [Candidatus Omnitrophica bacterium]|nr:HAMP domain-containing protein [Candidatus Omnitrophota bacterium]
MKISLKVIFLVSFLLAFLAIDGFIGYSLLKRMGGELEGVVGKDVALMQTATIITRSQLQKAVVFERARRIAEELAYQETTPARKDYLASFTRKEKGNFEELAKTGALNIIKGKELINNTLHAVKDGATKTDLQKVANILKEIERTHIHYDALIGQMFDMILSGKYELSGEDIGQLHRDENKLSNELKNLLTEIERLTNQSLTKAGKYEKTAEMILWVALGISFFAGLIIAFWIIYSIDGPLKTLVKATQDVGAGKLDVRLNDSSRDEIGEVSRSFNTMTRQLIEAKKELERQSDVLRHNLELTEAQKKDLEKVNRELDRFVQTVSHDIRSPLMGISWYADFLKNHHYATLDDKGKECLEGVCRGVVRANALIKDLLVLTRISRVRNPYEYVQIGALVDEVLGNLEYKIKQNNVDLHIQKNMPAIICDGIKIKEVFLNFLTNAIKFSSGNPDVQPRVDVGYQENVDSHEFTIHDNGIGIAPENHDEIFAVFKRLDTSDKYEGTGVGLGIVKSVIDDHGGKIWIDSDLGKGATFHFTIPKGLESHKPVVA